MAPKAWPMTPESAAAAGDPWSTTPPLSRAGAVLGVDLRTHGLILLDPWLLKVMHIIHSIVFLVLGQKDHGKSTLVKILAARLATLQPGLDPYMTVRIHDRKPEGRRGEYGPLTEAMQSDTILLRNTSINILDPAMRMSIADLIDTLVSLIEEQTGGGHLVGLERLALQIAIKRMMSSDRSREHASLHQLALTTRSLTFEDVEHYYAGLAADLSGVANDDAEMYRRIQLPPPPDRATQTRTQFLHDADQVAGHLTWITDGPFGGIFGSSGSLRDQLSQPIVTLDWAGVNESARPLLESMMWRWTANALVNQDYGLIPHMEVTDEEHEVIADLGHARARSTFIRKSRAFHTALFLITQYLTDFLTAGNAGSEIRGLANDMLRGIGAFIIGKQEPDDATMEFLTGTLHFSEVDAQLTTQMPQGWFWLVVRDRPAPILFQFIVHDSELPLIATGSAGERMVARQLSMSDEEMADIARRYGATGVHTLLTDRDYTGTELQTAMAEHGRNGS